ncbi:hypothetical protein ZWY2020_005975 [Hordeum vulgare]|nr:hypothetical protein ZWY2020_005975 [Hordeum vulgare]
MSTFAASTSTLLHIAACVLEQGHATASRWRYGQQQHTRCVKSGKMVQPPHMHFRMALCRFQRTRRIGHFPAMYSASHVDAATTSCLLLHQLTAPPFNTIYVSGLHPLATFMHGVHVSRWNQSHVSVRVKSIRCNLLLRCVCRDPMNCGFMIRLSMNLI